MVTSLPSTADSSQAVDPGQGPRALHGINLHRLTGLNGMGQFRILQGQQLAVDEREVHLVGPKPVAAEQLGSPTDQAGSREPSPEPASPAAPCPSVRCTVKGWPCRSSVRSIEPSEPKMVRSQSGWPQPAWSSVYWATAPLSKFNRP